MNADKPIFGSIFRGWRLIGATAAILCLGIAFIVLTTTTEIESTRSTMRYTARVSVILFLSAFSAAALWQLWPGSFTQWLRANRRYLGLSFALSHFTHLAAIFMLATLDPALFAALTRPASRILGGLAYVLLAMMVATSFDVTARKVGPKAWSILHTTGSYFILLIFANSFISRALTMPGYILPALAVVAALALRLTAWLQRSRKVGLAGKALTVR